MRTTTISLIVLAVVVLVVGSQTLFQVAQINQAIVLRLGEPVKVHTDPGLKLKLPFIEDYTLIDNRVLDLDSPSQEVIAKDQKRLVVDAFLRYRIVDPLLFFQRANRGQIAQANNLLNGYMGASIRRVLGDAVFIDIVKDRRAELMAQITEQVNNEAKDIGVVVLDIRIRRADLPDDNSQAIYQRMQAERQQEASEIRALGEEARQGIIARADREVTVINGNANRDSSKILGRGEAKRIKIFADAFSRDAEFFRFWKSLQTMESTMANGTTDFTIDADSEFLRFLQNVTPESVKSNARVRP